MSDYRAILDPALVQDEGYRKYPYDDKTGNRPPAVGNISIGIGRNLDDPGLRPNEIKFLYANDVKDAEALARSMFPDFDKLSPVRQAVLVNMSFNLGPRFKGFFRTINLINQGQWSRAADAMKESLWYRQLEKQGRSVRLVRQFRDDRL